MNKQLNKNLKNIYNNTNKKIQTINNILEIDRCIDNTLWFFSIRIVRLIRWYRKNVTPKNIQKIKNFNYTKYVKILLTYKLPSLLNHMVSCLIYLLDKYYYKKSYLELCIQLFQEDDHKNLNLHLRGRLDIYQKIKTTVTDIYTFLKYLTIYLIQKYYYKTSEVEFIKTMLYGKWEERRDMFEFFSTLNRYIRPNNAPKPSRWWVDIYIITLFWILHIPVSAFWWFMNYVCYRPQSFICLCNCGLYLLQAFSV